jgi:putative spermidine/putrescine transport system substrate-binding protein
MILGFLCQPVMAAEIVMNVSGGAYLDALKKCFFDDFEKASGNKMLYEPGANFAKLTAMVKSGNVEWDIAEAEYQDLVILGAKDGVLEPMDYTIINKKDTLKEAMGPYSVGTTFYSTVLAYNAEKYPKGKEPRSWKDFWDVKKFPGPRALEKNPYNNLEFALMADGVPPGKLYPLDVDRAFRSLDKIKPHVKVWWTAGAQPAQLLTDKEVDLTSAWNGRIFTIQKQGAKVEIQWNEGIIMTGAWVIPKGAKNKKAAMELLNFFLIPERQARFAEAIGYPGVSMKIFDFVDPKLAPHLPTYPEHYKKQVAVNNEWWVENRNKMQERWNSWLLK